MKPMLRGIAVAVAATGLVACVKQAWTVTYPGTENYSLGNSVLVEENGTAYMAGYLNEQSVFLAAYSPSGKLLWDRVIDQAGPFLPRVIGRTLEQDAAGNIYWLQTRDLGPALVFKVAPTGELLATFSLQEGAYPAYIRLIGDVLYTENVWPPALNAYDLDGTLLWSYSPETAPSPESDLPYYPGNNAVASQASSSNGTEGLFGITAVLKQDGRLYLNSLGGIAELDEEGNEVQFQSAAALGLEAIFRTVEVANGLMVIGASGMSTYAVVLDLDLSEVSRTLVAESIANGAMASPGDGVVCLAMEESAVPGDQSLRIQQLDTSGNTNWIQSVALDELEDPFIDVLADGDACYLTINTYGADQTLSVQTQRYDNAGQITDTFNVSNFGVTGMTVQGKSVYHVGITGEYDGSATIATLNKQSRKQ